MKPTILPLLLCCILLQSCEKQDTTPSSNTMSFNNTDPCNEVATCPTWYPVEIGNEWKWNSLLGSFRVRITGDTTMNGKTYFTSRFVGGTILTFLNEWCWIYGYITPNGDLREYDPDSGRDWLYLPSSPVVGQSWLRNDSQWEVLSVNETLQTPACNYTSLLKVQITDTNDGSIDYGYFGKGLGLIYAVSSTNPSVSYYLQDVDLTW